MAESWHPVGRIGGGCYNEDEGKGLSMTYHGQVKNGVVVLDDGASLLEGTAVRVEPIPRESKEDHDAGSVFRLAERAKPTGIRDLGINHDHYLYGHPKVIDG